MYTEEMDENCGYKTTEGARGTSAAEKKKFGVFCDEQGYLDQIEYIMQYGCRKGDRTGTGVISMFGAQARYSLRGSFAIILYNLFCLNRGRGHIQIRITFKISGLLSTKVCQNNF